MNAQETEYELARLKRAVKCKVSCSGLAKALSSVPSFPDQAAALAAGLVLGDTFYNSSTNIYTRVN